MREYKVRYYIEKNGVRSDEYETVPVQASSTEEAIDLVKDYLQDQVIQNSEYTAKIQKDGVFVIGGEDIVEIYCDFSAESEIKKARIEAGITSRAEMSRVFEIPIRTLENWESGVRIPPHWAEKLIIEKLEQIKNGK